LQEGDNDDTLFPDTAAAAVAANKGINPAHCQNKFMGQGMTGGPLQMFLPKKKSTVNSNHQRNR
jgi:hypothetical protein